MGLWTTSGSCDLIFPRLNLFAELQTARFWQGMQDSVGVVDRLMASAVRQDVYVRISVCYQSCRPLADGCFSTVRAG